MTPRTKKPRPAHPASVDADAGKDEVVRFRCTTGQKAALKAAAARDGRELSNWLRWVALREAGADPGADTTVSAPGKARR